MKKICLIGLAILWLLLSLAGCGVVNDVQQAGDAGNSFMAALKSQDNTASWAMLTDAVQQEIGGTDAWANFTQPRAFDSWNFSATTVQNNQAQLDGEGVLNGDTYTIRLVLDKVQDIWKISWINLKLK